MTAQYRPRNWSNSPRPRPTPRNPRRHAGMNNPTFWGRWTSETTRGRFRTSRLDSFPRGNKHVNLYAGSRAPAFRPGAPRSNMGRTHVRYATRETRKRMSAFKAAIWEQSQMDRRTSNRVMATELGVSAAVTGAVIAGRMVQRHRIDKRRIARGKEPLGMREVFRPPRGGSRGRRQRRDRRGRFA